MTKKFVNFPDPGIQKDVEWKIHLKTKPLTE